MKFEHSLALPFFGIGMKTPFAVLWPLLSFPNFPEFVGVHTVKGLGIVSEAEVDIFLELS